MKTAVLFVCLTGVLLGGCSMLSRAGPMASEVVAGGQAGDQIVFDVVPVDDRVVSTLLAQPKVSFHTRFENNADPPALTIAIGDTISVTIWESAAGGLFSETPPERSSTGSRPATEPLSPEFPPPGPETPGGSNPPLDQLFGIPSPRPGTSTPSPGRPPGAATRPFSTETAVATDGRRGATIPDQPVARDGAISVPYAGRVAAAGRTPAEVQQTIERLLAEKALEPQALVIVKNSSENAVTVTGGVVAGARVPLSAGGDRLLQVIAATGGTFGPAVADDTSTLGATITTTASGITTSTAVGGVTTTAAAGVATIPIHEIFVRLSRNGVTATIPLERLVADPAEDIYARPGDVVTLVRAPQTFSVFGAAGRNAAITFGAEKITLSEALAKSQGLRDDLANPKGVFLFRYEPASIVRALDQPMVTSAQDGISPVVYRFDLADANSYFIANRFPVRDKDIIFVADAGAAQVQKVFALISTVTGPITTGLLVCRSGNTKC
jgi:polysaccharide export outer membrane protein